MTNPPGPPGEWQQAQPMPPGYPQQPYPGQPYPQSPYPGQPPYPGRPTAPGAGTTITASILLSLGCVGILWSLYTTIRLFAGPFRLTPLATGQDILASLAGVLVVVATIMLWARQPVARLLSIIGLAVILALDLFNLTRPVYWHLIARQPIGVLEIVLNIAALVLVCLPSTAVYLKARRTRPSAPLPPGYPPRQW